MSKEEIGKNIKKIREQKGLTQIFLAKELGYNSSSSISEIESGKKGLDAHQIPLLAKILNVNIEDIFSIK